MPAVNDVVLVLIVRASASGDTLGAGVITEATRAGNLLGSVGYRELLEWARGLGAVRQAGASLHSELAALEYAAQGRGDDMSATADA
ncbi:hypothetical protein ACGFZQ_29690 [Streptomyces sp. NPDC048254]|uniref:hypothetical protein n=1 Tax=Streptomyces sp. NPDC048254 TaxID=3365525 RepID=UPI00371B4533